MSSAPPGKKSTYKRPTIDQKIKIIRQLEAGGSIKTLAEEYGMNPSTIRNIRKHRKTLLNENAYVEETHGSRKRSWSFAAENPQLDSAMYHWFLEKKKRNEPVSGCSLKEQALYFNNMLRGPEDFQASNGWIEKFKKRHGISLQVRNDDELSIDVQAGEDFIEFFKAHIAEKGYDLDAVYNAHGTGIYWRSQPSKVLLSPNEQSMLDFKTPEDRVTVMACANATGTHTLPLLVVGRSNKPGCFKNITHLPVTYRGQKNVSITREIFIEWFTTLFLTSVKERIGNKKFLLLLDNAPTHPPAQYLNTLDEMCEAMYLPSTVTSVILPMEQGVIASIKRHYKRSLLRELLLKKDQSMEKFFGNLNMLKFCEHISAAWDCVSQQVLKHAWKNFHTSEASFQDISSEAVTDEVQYTISEILRYARSIESLQNWTAKHTTVWLDQDVSEFAWGRLSNEQLIKNEYEASEEANESLENDASEMVDEHSAEEPTCHEALKALDTFTQWYRTQWGSEHSDFLALRKIRKVAVDSILDL